jgi:lantibiotic modifying enzyme
MCSWCHGAGGIVLARVAADKLLGLNENRPDVAAGIETVRRQPIQDLDHYCCGNAGRIEILFTVGQLLGRADLVEEARGGMARLLDRAANEGGFQLFRELRRGTYNPSLFCGSAGIGYQLLRLSRPDSLPCLLLWE